MAEQATAEQATRRRPPSSPTDPLADLNASTAVLASVDADLAAAQASIDELLKQASFEDPATLNAGDCVEANRRRATPPGRSGRGQPQAAPSPGDPVVRPAGLRPDRPRARTRRALLGSTCCNDVELNVKIELGRSRMMVEDVLKLGEGSVVELDKLAGDPVDVYVNDKLVARGEVLVLNDNFCVRVNEIVAGATG